MSRRTKLFVFTLLMGLVLTILGVALSAPVGPTSGPEYSDPRVEYAPLMFVLGITIMFGSAVVYELAPEKRER